MKKKQFFWLIIIIFFLIVLAYLFLTNQRKNTANQQASNVKSEQAAPNFLLANYPLSEVPLYQSVKVSSCKFFVNDDPVGFAGYFGQPVNYYNVVFETEATASELLNYYRSLMSEVNEESSSNERVEGKIGRYKISASHYGDNPQNYAYLQVYLPAEDYQSNNPYYDQYPSLVELDPSWVEYESSYGYLNQNGGEIEYFQYFSLPVEEQLLEEMIARYQEQHQSENNFAFNQETGLMTWKKDAYSVYLTFSKDHGRVYLMIRLPKS